MLENLNFCLLCTLFTYLYIRMKRYLPLFKMAEEIFSGLQSDTKCQKLLEAFSPEIASYTWVRFTQKISSPSLTKKKWKSFLIIMFVRMLFHKYVFNGSLPVLGISNQDALSEDLETDPFLNSALQRATCELYYRFGSFLAPLSIVIITSRYYLSECNKSGERTSGMGHNKNGEDERAAE